MERIRSCIVALAVLVFAGSALASEVTLTNGDRLSGNIVAETEDSVTLETEYLGKITIMRKFIDRIAKDREAGTGPNNAAAATATAAKPKADSKPPADGSVKAAKENVNARPAPPFKPTPRRLFGGRYMGLTTGWDGNVNVGFSYTSGNSNNTTMTTGLRAVKAGGRDNLTVYVRSLWNNTKSSGRRTTTQNAFWGGARYDRNIGDNFFGFVSYDFERDSPKKLNFRSVAGGGVGRHMLKSKRTELDLLSGLAWNRTWQFGENTDTPEMLFGTALKHKFHERLKLQKSFTFYQNVTDRREYRFLFDATLSADVTKRIGIFLTFGDRFNNDPIGTARKNDFLFTTGMKWNFGNKGK